MRIAFPVLTALLCLLPGAAAQSQNGQFVHGLWVWKTPTLLDLPSRGEALRDFCRSNQINEVYLSFTSQNTAEPEQQEIGKLIELLHKSRIRINRQQCLRGEHVCRRFQDPAPGRSAPLQMLEKAMVKFVSE